MRERDTAMRDMKYVVFKREEFISITDDKGTATQNELLRAALDDAVVIRLHDPFAAPALDGYASSIAVAIEVIQEAGVRHDVINGLQSAADYFAEAAVIAHETSTKLPD